ncbi:HIT domain-containing protein [Campylobacter sp. Cr9]|uniref:HIT family protein n=1 Tax=Campylobacter sp. Cr9 TaxID=2735728 RepID=UPI003014CA2A|nr:HIT domain-containing protein [Campylobacter sp. Cr9]
MQYLNAPWRDKYFNEDRSLCPFCEDSEVLVYEDDDCRVLMNKYPYSPGHILITPKKHCEFLNELDENTWLKMAKIARFAENIMLKTLKAQGVNIGFNLGDAAGAGIAKHLHLHVLPRWYKDTNFITTICDTRVLGTSSDELYLKIKESFKNYNANN